MKRVLALLLLAGCNSEDQAARGGGGQPGLGDAALSDLESQSGGADPAQLQARAAAALSGILIDPGSARYANIRAGAAEAICGEVDAKQMGGKFSGFRPFVVSPDGVAVVSPTPKILFNDPGDLFPDFYIRWCASPEELDNLGTRVAAGDPALIAPVSDFPPDNAAAAALPAVPVPDMAAASPARPAPSETTRPPSRPSADRPAEPAAGNEDSFFKAVKRKSDPTISSQ